MKILDFIRLVRLSQWYKNLLIFLHIIFSLNLLQPDKLWLTFLGFISLCLISSSNYIINDIIDLKKDRLNPEKKNRPLASGRVKIWQALIIFAVFAAISIILALNLNMNFLYSILFLFGFTLFSSLILKKEPFADHACFSSPTVNINSGSFGVLTAARPARIGQFALQTRPENEFEPLTLERLPRGRFAVRDATLDVLDLRARQGRFELTGADIELERRGGHVTARGRVKLPEHLGSKLEFEADVEGDLADAASLAWRGSLDAYDLDFEQWAALLPESFRLPAAGQGSFELSVRGAGRELAGLRLQPSIRNLRFAGAADEFKRIVGDIRLQQRNGAIAVRAAGLELSRRGAQML